MSEITRPADRDDLRRIWPAVNASHVFDDYAELVAWWEAAPWRVRVTRAGEAAVLGRWRAQLDLLAVKGLWCATERIPVLLEDLSAVARAQGFARLLGPLVPDDAVAAYLTAGFEERQRIVVYRMQPPLSVVRPAPAGVEVRIGLPTDRTAVAALDASCFDEFWRYDEESLRAYFASERLGVAEDSGRVVGYTLSTVHGVEGTVGRLAVTPEWRGRGIGTALLADSVAYLARKGALAVTLCTQEENDGSRRLYRKAGFRESPGRLVSTISPMLQGLPATTIEGREGRS
ncbi:MAG: GNAT family N-acetyltransferase [Coriobacteriia bacterium]|nr:GNAT family N-acetyltransferase [Coriobacteriia bacterium]